MKIFKFFLIILPLIIFNTGFADDYQAEINNEITNIFKRCENNISTKYKIYNPTPSPNLTEDWNNYLYNYTWTLEPNEAIAILIDIIILDSPNPINFTVSDSTFYKSLSFPKFDYESIKKQLDIIKESKRIIEQKTDLDFKILLKRCDSLPNVCDSTITKSCRPEASSVCDIYSAINFQKSLLEGFLEVNSQYKDNIKIINKNDDYQDQILKYIESESHKNKKTAYIIDKMHTPFTDECGNIFLNDNLYDIKIKNALFSHEATHILLREKSIIKTAYMHASDQESLAASNSIVVNLSEKFFDGEPNNIRYYAEQTKGLANMIKYLKNDKTIQLNDELLIDAISIVKSEDPIAYLEMLKSYTGGNTARINVAKAFFNTLKSLKKTSFPSRGFMIDSNIKMKKSILNSNYLMPPDMMLNMLSWTTTIDFNKEGNFNEFLNFDKDKYNFLSLLERSLEENNNKHIRNVLLYLATDMLENLYAKKNSINSTFHNNIEFKNANKKAIKQLSSTIKNFKRNPNHGF